MKKYPKIRIFSTLNYKKIIICLFSIALLVSLIVFPCSYISKYATEDFVKLIVSTATKSPLPQKTNIAQKMLSLSLPALTFSPSLPVSEPVVKPSSFSSLTTPISPIPAPEENTAVSITYEDSEEKGYTSVDGLYINNLTKKTIDIASLLNTPLDLNLSTAPTVLIVHTHTTESYTPSEKYNYIPTETDRTTDSEFNMVSVGEVIYNELTKEGISVIHDKSVNDYPSYSTSYSNSLKLVKSYMEKYPSIKIVIDVHRDAIVTKDGKKMRPVTSFDESCAQVMMVVGTNDSGLNHPTWQKNLSFALKLQSRMNSLYPSLARPINLRKERFNQHMAPYAFILEVGTNGNTLEEAKEGARLFSLSLLSLLKN